MLVNSVTVESLPLAEQADGAYPTEFTDAVAEDPLPPLRKPYPVESIDPLTVAPNPGAMGQLYIDMRQYVTDGMSLACAEPMPGYTYQQNVDDYTKLHEKQGFSSKAFWEQRFRMTDPDDQNLEDHSGLNLEVYLRNLRSHFLLDNTDNNSFDVWLPYRRSVAGAGRFSRHSFLWDGYQMAKGYAADNEWGLVLDVADNYEYQINKFSCVLNGSAEFYATRSQPPYFSSLINMIAEKYGDEAFKRYLPAMEKEYQSYWMDGKDALQDLPDDGKAHEHRTLVRVPLGNGKFGYLNRYWDDLDTPRLESYKEDVDLGRLVTEGLKGAVKQRRLQKLYRDLRAGAASGWDYSSRWFEDGVNLETINTTDILPIDLNSLMARTEQILARAHFAAGNYEKAFEYLDLAEARTQAINALMWDAETNIYRDYNYVKKDQTKIVSGAMAYPLYCGIASVEQALGVADAIDNELLFEGGVVATTTAESTQQWDGGKRTPDGKIKGNMNVWAPVNWVAARGLARAAHTIVLTEEVANADPWLRFVRRHREPTRIPRALGEKAIQRLLTLSEKTRNNYMHGIRTVYGQHRRVTEKHRGDRPADSAGGGEYKLVKVLAMPGETFMAMDAWDPRSPKSCMSIGRMTLTRAA